jgi:hypothetical protein
MYPACHSYDDECADYCGADYRNPLVAYDSEATHHSHTRWNKKESQIPDQKISDLIDRLQPDPSGF